MDSPAGGGTSAPSVPVSPVAGGVASAVGGAGTAEAEVSVLYTYAFSFSADSLPADVVIDPATWVLMEPPQFARRTP